MGQSYIGEIRIFAGNYAPSGWMLCQGQLVNISDYNVLFNLLGTTYGGDGQNTFGLPDLRGRLAFHQGNGFNYGSSGGAEQVTLTANQIPGHNHPVAANGNTDSGTSSSGTNALFGVPNAGDAVYGSGTGTTALSGKGVDPVGGSQPHSNIKPYLTLNFIISLSGIYPSQS